MDQQPLPAPVIYSGSIERTSFAERNEDKYFVIMRIYSNLEKPIPVFKYYRLPTRPMVNVDIPIQLKHQDALKELIQVKLAPLDPDSIVKIRLTGQNTEGVERSLSASFLRAITPPTMNITLAYPWNGANQAKIRG